jgi:membrane-bound lytic murein transglycosylase D
MTFKQISDLLDIPVAQIQLLNPSYKLNIVPRYSDKMYFLRLPSEKIAVFASNENKIYAYVEHESQKREKPYFQYNGLKDSTRIATSDAMPKSHGRTKYHTVRRGDNLSEISEKYGVTIAELKKWNKLKSNKIPLGRKLKIVVSDNERIASVEKKEPKMNNPKEDQSVSVPETKIKAELFDKEEKSAVASEFYIVQKGDNLGNIAKKFGVSISELKEWNNMEDNNVLLDTRLKILKERKEAVAELEEEIIKPSVSYIVQKGDNLGTIAKKYGVNVSEIKEWNEITDNNIQAGNKLLILKDNRNSQNIAANDRKDALSKDTHYLVRKGDSLFTIAKKYPGVTVSDIKKWNGINGDDLKPGMKLKING